MRNFCQTKNSPQNQHHLHPSLGTFLIKFMFSSFSICWNHFTSLAYEIFYARKVDLFDKIKEVNFFQLFPCVWRWLTKGHGSQFPDRTIETHTPTELCSKVTDGQTDGWHNEFSRAHFLKMCTQLGNLSIKTKSKTQNFQNSSFYFRIQEKTSKKFGWVMRKRFEFLNMARCFGPCAT
jgi:hypothetical protein